jgi:hypothetical protein
MHVGSRPVRFNHHHLPIPTHHTHQQVNIIAWTAVGLVVTLLMALCLLFGADSGPKDSLLYAKFQVPNLTNLISFAFS